jgi:DNA-binding NarL/FixJ family response regulator
MAGEKKSIVIAEDHTILREGLRALISSNPDFDVVAEAGDGHEAVKCVERIKPNLVLMDLSMPRMNGMEAIREIRKRIPDTKIVVLTIHDTEEYILETIKTGANGYVLKDATHNELMMALNTVLDGRRYISPGISDKVIEGYLDGKSHQTSNPLGDPYPSGAGDSETHGRRLPKQGDRRLSLPKR